MTTVMWEKPLVSVSAGMGRGATMAVALHFGMAAAILLFPYLMPPPDEPERVIEIVLAPDMTPASEPEQQPPPQPKPVAEPVSPRAPASPTKIAKVSPPKPQAVSEAVSSEPAASVESTAGAAEAAPSSSESSHPAPSHPALSHPAPSMDGPPAALDMPRPSYPRLARQRGWEGMVTLTVEVNELGCPNSVTVKRSSGYSALDEAAVEAARRWHFRPAVKDGRVTIATVEVPIRFSLSDA